MVKRIKLDYFAEPTLAQFHRSHAFVRGIRGPVRSGKSTGCTNELFRRAANQAPWNGRRRTRFAVIRNTYSELQDTTIKTWLNWWQEDIFGPLNRQTMTHTIRYKDIESEVLFRALDRPKDIRKLLSMELTGAWVNEAREIAKPVIDALIDRLGQFPPKREGGCTWFGLIMDTNPPDTDHWWYKLSEEQHPEGWEFFSQPGGLMEVNGEFLPNPAAENIGNLSEGYDYYLRRMAGKGLDHVRVYYCGQYGFVVDGRPVHPNYADHLHCSREELQPDPRQPIIVGIDFGLTPAACFLQRLQGWRWIAFDELVATSMGANRFSEVLKRHIAAHYPKFKFSFFGDPAGDERVQTDEETVFQILNKNGIPAVPCFTNDTTIRRESLDEPLGRLVDGFPGFMLSPRCKVLRKGLMGGFCYRRVQVAGEARYHDQPVKNEYSHIVEACEYGLLGGGEGERVISAPNFEPLETNYLKNDPSYSPTRW